MPTNLTIPPETDRLAFREWRGVDLNRFHMICSDQRVMRHVGDGRVWSRERTVQFIQAAAETHRDHGFCQWPLIHKADGELIGYCGFANTAGAPEIGWRLAPDYWGHGLATEAAKVVLKHGWETLRFRMAVATVQAANVASIRVIEKLGMTLVSRFERDGREILAYATNR